MLRRAAAFGRPLRPVLLLVSSPLSRSPAVGVPGLCWLWHALPPLPRVQQTIKSSKNKVRTGVFVGHAIRYPINSARKPGTQFMKYSPDGSVRWTRGAGGGGGGRGGGCVYLSPERVVGPRVERRGEQPWSWCMCEGSRGADPTVLAAAIRCRGGNRDDPSDQGPSLWVRLVAWAARLTRSHRAPFDG